MNIFRFLKHTALAAALLIPLVSLADITHVAKRGETIFGLSKKYNVSVDQLLQWNPQASNGIKKGMTIVIKDGNGPAIEPEEQTVEAQEQPVVAESQPETPTRNALPDSHIAKRGESLKSIGKEYGLSEDRLIELNPFLDPDGLKEGDFVRLTDDAPLSSPDAPASEPENHIADFEADESEYREEPATPVDPGRRNIMVLLPFMSSAEKQPRRAEYYTDFYRGFLLAAKELTDTDGEKVEIIALDTDGDPEKLNNQLKYNAHREIAAIIAPEDENQLHPIIDFASENGIYVINLFNFKDTAYLASPYVLQANIDQALMYQKAIAGIMATYPDHIPVILTSPGAKAEKASFTDALKERYIDMGIPPLEISFDGTLTQDDLSALDPLSSYVFVPQSGSLGIFNSIAPAIQALQNEPGGTDHYVLFGYPDWTAFRGESLHLLHALGANIYSRFYINELDPAVQGNQEQFTEWYGEAPIEAVPSQSILGYDTGKFLIRALQEGTLGEALEGKGYKGLQSAFSFGKANDGDGGYINRALFLIRYNPDNTCNAIVL